MIVTCPNCTTKFRVRDESVPEEGAQLKCATCATVFMAYAPKKTDDDDIKGIVEKLTTAKDAALERAVAAEAQSQPLRQRLANFESELHKLRTQNLQLSQETDDLRRGRDAIEQRFHDEVSRLQRDAADVAALRQQVSQLGLERDSAAADAADSNRLKDELMRVQGELLKVRASAALQAPEEVRQLKTALESAQRSTGRLTGELESAQEELTRLRLDGGTELDRDVNGSAAGAERVQLMAEVERLRRQLAMVVDSGRAFVDPAELLAAVGPLLWGLDNAIDYIGPFAGTEPLLQGHFRQLQLLSGVIHRLQASNEDLDIES